MLFSFGREWAMDSQSGQTRIKDCHDWPAGSFCFRQFGQYQGAGVLTGFGLLFRHLAQRKRLPLMAVFGRTFLPVLRMFFAIGTSTSILSKEKQVTNDMVTKSNPFVVYRIDGKQMECALWQFKDGQKALALFLSGDAATSYRASANLGDEWKVFSPAREALLEMLKGCQEAGIGYAVLDPDQEKAKRIFSIPQVLKTVGS